LAVFAGSTAVADDEPDPPSERSSLAPALSSL
jgi:hypothetical protein